MKSSSSISPAVVCLALIVAARAAAEGSVTVIDCGIARVCDAAGRCEDGSGQVSFRLEPVQRNADGSASYTLSYGGVEADMQALSDAGPFVWSTGSERNVLLASSETEWLWHQVEVAGSARASIRFLHCTFER